MLRPQEQGAGGVVCAQTRAPLGWAVPPPWHRLSACADRPWLGVLLVGWGLRTWGHGRLWAWLAGVRGGCQWPMAVGWGRRTGSAVSWRPLPGPAGACSALEKQRSAAWPPASRCLPPTTAVAVRSSSSFPESWGLWTGSGARAGGSGWSSEGPDPRRGRVCPWQARVLGACVLLPGAHSSGLGLWVSCPGALTHDALGPVLGLTLGDVLGDVGAGRQPAFVLSPSWSPARLWEARDAGEEPPADPSLGVL